MKTVTSNPEAPAVSNAAVRVLKIANCPSLSGKSTLTYHIGCAVNSEANGEGICTPESDIQFRIVDNSNIGFFSQEWVPMSVIQREFDKVPVGKTITSFLLHPLFQGKSVNTPAFLFAVLKNEGLVEMAKDKQRHYVRMDPAGFLSAIQALIASKVELKWDEPSKRKASKTGTGESKTGAGPTKRGAGPSKTGATSEKSGKKSKGKTAKVDAKTVAPTPAESPSQTEASPPKVPIVSANGVDIAEIVEVINAKVDAKPQGIEAKTNPPMPAKKPAAKAKK